MGNLPFWTGFDKPYIRGIIDTKFLSSFSSLTVKGFPLKISYYVYYAMKENSPDLFKFKKKKEKLIDLTTKAIHEIYLSQWKFLNEQFKNKRIKRKQRLVAQDVIDRYFLNTFLNISHSITAETRNIIFERWKPLFMKRAMKKLLEKEKKQKTQIDSKKLKELKSCSLSISGYSIINTLKKIEKIIRNPRLLSEEKRRWKEQQGKILKGETDKPFLVVYPIFIGGLREEIRQEIGNNSGFSIKKEKGVSRFPQPGKATIALENLSCRLSLPQKGKLDFFRDKYDDTKLIDEIHGINQSPEDLTEEQKKLLEFVNELKCLFRSKETEETQILEEVGGKKPRTEGKYLKALKEMPTKSFPKKIEIDLFDPNVVDKLNAPFEYEDRDHIKKVADKYDISSRQIRRYIQRGDIEGGKHDIYLLKTGGAEIPKVTNVLFIKSSPPYLEKRKNYKGWIQCLIKTKKISNKQAK